MVQEGSAALDERATPAAAISGHERRGVRRLEESLAAADETRRRLLESLLCEALAPDEGAG